MQYLSDKCGMRRNGEKCRQRYLLYAINEHAINLAR